jgi:hypothetical protein
MTIVYALMLGHDEDQYTAGIFSNKLDAEKHAAAWARYPASPETSCIVEYELDDLNSVFGLTSWEVSLDSEGSFLCAREGGALSAKNDFFTTSVGLYVRAPDGEWKGKTTLPNDLYCRARVMARDEAHAKELATNLYEEKTVGVKSRRTAG